MRVLKEILVGFKLLRWKSTTRTNHGGYNGATPVSTAEEEEEEEYDEEGEEEEEVTVPRWTRDRQATLVKEAGPSRPAPARTASPSPEPVRAALASHGASDGVMAILAEMRDQRADDNRLRKEESAKKSTGEEAYRGKSVFYIKPQADFPILGDNDRDIEAHVDDFEDMVNLCDPVHGIRPAEKLKLFGKTLKGNKKEVFRTVTREAKVDDEISKNPQLVLDRVITSLKSDFHETVEARNMRAKNTYEALDKGKKTFQEFQLAWKSALADLTEAGIYKGETDLFYDYLKKIGSQLKQLIMTDYRFFPMEPAPGEQPEYRKAKTWQEGASMAKDSCQIADASRALTDHSFSVREGGGKGGGGTTYSAGQRTTDGKKCSCCGKENHTKKDCRFKDKTCNKCGKVGHIGSVCRSAANGSGQPPPAVKNTYQPSGKPQGGSACTCCGMTNHTKKDCKHKDKNCSVCGKTGHLSKVCKSGGNASKGKGKGKGGERTYVQAGVPSDATKCHHCERAGHQQSLCPKKAAEKRSEVEPNMAEFKKTGAVCMICAGVGLTCGEHRAKHHGLAAQDQYAVSGGGKAGGGKGEGKNKKGGDGAKGGGKNGGGKGASGPKPPCKLYAIGKCTYSPCRFAHDSVNFCGEEGAEQHDLQ
jgi:hypothetical protein